MAWTIAEDINGIKVTLNPSPINKIAIVALIGSVLRTRKISPPQKCVCALLIWPGWARNRERDQRRAQTQPHASWPYPILARPHGVSRRRMDAPVKARARVDCAGTRTPSSPTPIIFTAAEQVQGYKLIPPSG